MVEEILIEKVRHYVFLYDKTHEDYRDCNVRQAAWEEIGRALLMSGPAAKEMWDKLRRCLTNARNRHFESKKNGSGVKKKLFWKYEKQMSFLLPFLQTRTTPANLNDTQDGLQDYIDEIADVEIKQPGQTSTDPEDETTVEEHLFQSRETAAEQIRESAETPQWVKRNESRKKSPPPQFHPAVILEEPAPLKKRKFEQTCKAQDSKYLDGLDEIDLFFLSMSRMTKKLPKLEQARIKLELSNSVLSAEIQLQQSNSSASCPQRAYRFAGHHSPTTVGSFSE